ncbi:MAG: M48 family metalloprotease [Planctomycetia bacterium]
MLPDLTFLLAVLLGLGALGPGPHTPLLAFGGTAALTLVALALCGILRERALRALEAGEAPEVALGRATLLPLQALLAWWAALTFLGYGAAVYALLPATWALARYPLLFAPMVVAFAGAWAARARIEAAVATRLGRTVAHPSAGSAVRAGLRRNALALVPLAILLGVLEGLDLAATLGVPGCAAARALMEDLPQFRVLLEFGLFALLAWSLPWLMARMLPSEPFPAGPVRERLERLAQSLQVRYREMRLWKTGGRGVNAMVVGLTPRSRRIFVSDGLLQALPLPEVEAVFCHEAGHVRRWHLPWFLAITAVLSLAFVVLDEPLAVAGLPEGLGRSLLHLAVLWFVVLGTISRHFERESDVEGGLHAARLDPDAPPLELPGLPAPLPAGAARMVGALKRIEMLLGNVHSHRHGTPADRAAYVAWHATSEQVRTRFARSALRLRWGIVASGVLLAGVSLLRLPADLELARASGDLRTAREAHERAWNAYGKPEAAAAWQEAQAAYQRAADRLEASERVRAAAEAPLAWLGVADTALRGVGDLVVARHGFEQVLAGLPNSLLAESVRRRLAFESHVDLGRIALREGRMQEAAQWAQRAARGLWATEGPDGALARARLRLLEGTFALAKGDRAGGTAILRDLLGRTGSEDEWVELRRDAADELTRWTAPR